MRRSRARPLAALVLGLGAALCLIAGGAPGPPTARADELKIEAPKFSFDRENKTYLYEDGRLTLGDLSLFASRMQVNTAAGQVRASGYVRIESATVSGTATELELDTATRVGTLHGADLHDTRSGLYLRAETVRILPDGALELEGCNLTSCRPGTPAAWSINASSVSLEPQGLGFAWNPRLSLGPVPILWLPVLAWPTVNERRTGLLPPVLTRQGSSLKRFDLGWRLQTPLFINLGYDHDLTLTPDGIENRGGALAAEYNYAFWERQRGRLRLWGLRERDPRDPTQENTDLTSPATGFPTDPLRRYTGDWAHNQALGDDGRLVLTWHHSSDGQVRREYERTSELRPYRTYQATYSEQWDAVQAALTVEQNADYLDESVYARDRAATDLDRRPALSPRLLVDLGGRPEPDLPVSLFVGVDAARFQALDRLTGRMTAFSPGFSVPISLGGSFELRPMIQRHFLAFTQLTNGSGGSQERVDNAGFAQTEGTVEIRAAFARVYPGVGNRYDALKHRIVPRLLLTYVQDVARPEFPAPGTTPPFHDQVWPVQVAQELVTLRLDSVLLGRVRAPGTAPPSGDATAPAAGTTAGSAPPATPVVQELLRVGLIQRYNELRKRDAPPLVGPVPGVEGTGDPLPQETEAGQPLLPLLLEVNAGWPEFSAQGLVNWHHQQHRTTQRSLSMQWRPGARTRLGMAYGSNEFAFVTPDNTRVAQGKSLTFDGAVGLGESWTVGTSGRVNLNTDPEPPLGRKLDRAEVFTQYHPRCYVVRLGYKQEVVPTVVGGRTEYAVDRRVDVSLDLTGLIGGAAPASPTRVAGNGADAPGDPLPAGLAGAARPADCRG